MTRHWTYRAVAAVLTLVLLFQLMPLQTLAATTGSAAAEVSQEQAPASIIGEDPSLRTRTQKHFRLSDGSFLAVSYGVPVHYQDDTGHWQEIDNTLTASSGVYRAENGTATAAYAATLSTGQLFAVTDGDIGVSMRLLDTSQAQTMTGEQLSANANAQLIQNGLTYDRTTSASLVSEDTVQPATIATGSDTHGWTAEELLPEGLSASIVYEDVFPGVDLKYTAYSYNIKEQIIVNERQSAYRYDFFLELSGLTPTLNTDGSISLTDEAGAVAYTIPAPYMEDSMGFSSTAVTYTLTAVTGGAVLTVEADAAWINAEDRSFPVSIDPTLVLNTGNDNEDIYAAFSMELAPSDTTLGRQYLYVGNMPYGSSLGRYRLFMHFHNLPSIPEGSVITDATLQMYQFEFPKYGLSELPLAAYDVTTEKPSNLDYYYWFRQICWDTEPEYDTSNAVDYAIASATQGYRYWNLTELAKQWYAGTKDATIAIVVEDESVLSSAYGSAGFHAYSSGVPPILTVTYRSNVGIEPYYTYTTLGAGSAGTAYIADATGQLKVAKQLVSFSSSINPFAMSLVYNSDYFAANAAASYTPPSALGTNMLLGQGWTLDVIQRMDEVAIDNTNYVRYYDGDGTVHYFAPTGSYYYDEDGLGLKVQVKGSGGYIMTDDHGNTWTFTGNLLTAISDETGNQLLINYTSGRITTIQQKNAGKTAITVATFGYDSAGYLTTVTDYAGNVYTLGYSGGKLTSIKQGSTVIAQYAYSDNRITTLTDTESVYSITASWSGGKVSGYSEQANGTTGVQVSVSYPNHSHTAYRSSGNDRTLNNADDLITHYFMDYAGRTANAYTTDVSGNVLGATNAVYTANSGINKANNRTQRTASIGTAARQLMKNGGLEYFDSWTLGSTVSRSTEKPRSGLYSFKHSSSSTSAYITATNTTAYLTAGKTYTLSAYVNTAQMESCAGKGAYLAVRDSAWILFTSQCISQKTSASVNAGWERLSVTFTPTTTGYATVYGEAVGFTGTIYFDDFLLEEAGAPSNYNLIENGSMDLGSYGWTLDDSASFVTTTGVSASTTAIRILGSPMDSTTIAYQDVPVNLPGSETYVLSGWVKANAVPDNVSTASDSAQDIEKQCGLRAILTYSDGAVEYHYVPFNTDLQDWQFTSLTIVPKEPTKTVSTIRVVLAYEKNANTAYFDNISLVREAAQTMAYDGDGNLRSVTATGLTADTDTYSGGNLIQTETAGSGTYNYTYDTTYTHRLKSVTNGLVTQSMGYDSMGNVISTTLTGGSLSMATSAAYDATGNRLASVTDSAGSTVSYGYSSGNSTMWGLPTTVTAPNGTVTTTAYDSFGRVTQNSIANTASVGYTYSNGMLSSLQRTAGSNTQTYNFTYDSFGNTTSIKVGSTALASYTYASKNGLLSSMTYGNNATVSYTYDTLGRIKTETYADGRVVSYTYTGDGQLYSAKETKGSTSTLYVYTYDTLGRLVGSQQIKDGTTELRTDQTYNANNQLTKQAWQIGSTAYSETYTYNTTDGSLATHGTATGQTVSYSYDALRRISGVSSGVTTKQYAYRSLGNNRTTAQVASVSYPNLVTPLTFGYTYDAMGNIATYSDTGKGDVTYTYDAQGQLLKAVGDETYTYTYDAAGNLLTASDGTVSHSYTYGNTNWRDLLTAFDGESITYDAIGNPTSYYNGTRWTFGWSNGRQLTSASNGTSSITYTYTADGMRTSKVVDGVTYNYYYASGRLLRQTWGDNVLDFFYDEAGRPYAFAYGGYYYYYITNLQGDVTSIIDAWGAEQGSYEYDPYGNIVSCTGWAATLNPLRYRGYYYDTETGLYYLQSRYYDPATGRFINADGYVSTGQGFIGCNMFAYCLNNVINLTDPCGTVPSRLNHYALLDGSGGYITDQDAPGIGSKRFGMVNVSHGGCGAIATYNALITLGEPKSFDEVLSYYNENPDHLFLYGLAGTPPRLVAQYFIDAGYTVYVSDVFDYMDACSATADACIMFYMFPSTYSFSYSDKNISVDAFGAHYIEYSRAGNGYIGRNTGGARGTATFLYPSEYGYSNSRFFALGIFIYK